MNSTVGFWQRQLGSEFLVFARALPIRQWSLAPDAKICAASLPKSQLLNSFVYIPVPFQTSIVFGIWHPCLRALCQGSLMSLASNMCSFAHVLLQRH